MNDEIAQLAALPLGTYVMLDDPANAGHKVAGYIAAIEPETRTVTLNRVGAPPLRLTIPVPEPSTAATAPPEDEK